MTEVADDHRLVWAAGAAQSHTACKDVAGTWGEFVAWATAEPARSPETMAEFAALPHDQRTQAKRAPWIVGGPVAGGHRMSTAVPHRTILTVDIDELTPAAAFRLEYGEGFPRGWAYCGHTTRSSTPDSPRVRLYLPLAEPLAPEQYRLAALGFCEMIEQASVDEHGVQEITVDRGATTDLARLMYGPTLCSDAPHVPIVVAGGFPDTSVLVAAGRVAADRERVATYATPPPRSAPEGQKWGDERIDDYGIEAMRAAGAIITQSPRRRTELTTHCPWHDDRSPSLDITEEGKMVCRAGCRPGGEPITWLRYVAFVRGCSMREAFRFARQAAGLADDGPPPPARAGVEQFEDLGAQDDAPKRKAPFSFRPVAQLRPVEGLNEHRIWGEWITRTAVTILTGAPGIGKSTLSRNLMAALADGKDYLGVDGPGRPIKIAVLDYETAQIFEHHQWHKIYGDAAAFVENIIVADNPPFLTEVNLPALIRELAAMHPDLVVIDTVSAAFVLEDENSNSEMEGVVRIMRQIARTGPAVLALAHPSKGGADIRGASALLGGLDTLLTYTFDGARPDVVDETTQFVLASRKNRVGGGGTVRVQQDGEDGFVSPDEATDAVKAESQARIVEVLKQARRPMKRGEIYEQLSKERMSHNTVHTAIKTLARRGVIVGAGKASWKLAKVIWVSPEREMGGGDFTVPRPSRPISQES